MNRRKNADDRLRRLERAAKSGKYADKAAYWRALLQLNILPKADSFESGDGSESLWELEDGGDNTGKNWRRYAIFLDYYVPGASWEVGEYVNRSYLGHHVFKTEHEALEHIKKLLREELDKRENPARRKARNADDRLRRLERAAKSPGASATDIAAYWRMLLKSGIIPEPTVVLGTKDGKHARHIWLLGLKSEKWPAFYPRVILQLHNAAGKNPKPMLLTRWNWAIKDSTDRQLGMLSAPVAWEEVRKALSKYVDDFEIGGWKR